MKNLLKFVLLVVFCCFFSLQAKAEKNWNSWYSYDVIAGKTPSGAQQYCYLDLVGFGQWRNGQMVGCNPGGKGEYVYLSFSNLAWLFGGDTVVDFYWRNTGDGNWNDKYVLPGDDELKYAVRSRPGAENGKDITGWMKIMQSYSNSQGRYLITLDNNGIARKFKVVFTTHER